MEILGKASDAHRTRCLEIPFCPSRSNMTEIIRSLLALRHTVARRRATGDRLESRPLRARTLQFGYRKDLAMRILVALAALIASASLQADPLYVSYDNFNYSGTVTRYATLADAQAGTNAISTTLIATASNETRQTLPNARDGNLYVASSSPGYDPTNTAYFSTAWYYTTFPLNGNGWGNPNNSDTGFVQYYDQSAAPVVTGGWSNGNTRFNLGISGGNGGIYARLWAAPEIGGPAGDTAGVFDSFHLALTADFASAAAFNATTGWYDTGAEPTSLSGNASGIFDNQSTTNASLNGFYAFDFSFAPGSWAATNGATWSDGTNSYSPSSFFAAPVPEPASLALVALGLGALALAMRWRAG
jgi:hypothetical protein